MKIMNNLKAETHYQQRLGLLAQIKDVQAEAHSVKSRVLQPVFEDYLRLKNEFVKPFAYYDSLELDHLEFSWTLASFQGTYQGFVNWDLAEFAKDPEAWLKAKEKTCLPKNQWQANCEKQELVKMFCKQHGLKEFNLSPAVSLNTAFEKKLLGLDLPEPKVLSPKTKREKTFEEIESIAEKIGLLNDDLQSLFQDAHILRNVYSPFSKVMTPEEWYINLDEDIEEKICLSEIDREESELLPNNLCIDKDWFEHGRAYDHQRILEERKRQQTTLQENQKRKAEQKRLQTQNWQKLLSDKYPQTWQVLEEYLQNQKDEQTKKDMALLKKLQQQYGTS